MIENIAILAGVSALVVSIMACVAFLLLKKNIKDILQKDALVFDKNFEIKKNAITESFNIVDEVVIQGKSANLENAYIEKVIKCYNDLLCVMSNSQIVDEFYNIALNVNYPVNHRIITDYKLACRNDLGLKTKAPNMKAVKSNNKPAEYKEPVQQPAQPVMYEQPVQPQVAPQQPVQPRPVQPNPTQPRPQVRPAVRPTQSRPAQPRPVQPRPTARPVNTDEKK